MEKLQNLLLIIPLFLLLACGKDDTAIANEITYADKKYTATNGLIVDYGPQADSHYNYDFYISDGKISIVDGLLDLDESVTFYIYADLKSLGTDGFKPGVYTYNLTRHFAEKDIFVSPLIYINSGSSFEFFPGTGGTITIGGTHPNYIVTYDIISYDKLLSGSFYGTFDIQSGL